MKNLLIAVAVLGMLTIAGCVTPGCPCPCSKDEISILKQHKPIVLCKCGEIKGSAKCCDKKIPIDKKTGFHQDSIRDRLILSGQALNLTPNELGTLRKKNTVILCGDCGNIKGTDPCCKKGVKVDEATGFAENSIRNRIIGPYTD